MIFSPFVIFGHTWEFDSENKCITALMDRQLFYKYFVKNSHDSSNKFFFGSDECISIILTLHNRKKKQIKVQYEIYSNSTHLILSQPLTDKEKDVLCAFRTLCYQHHEQLLLIDNSKPQNIKDLELQDRDAINNYTIKIDGINVDRLVYKLFDWMNNN